VRFLSGGVALGSTGTANKSTVNLIGGSMKACGEFEVNLKPLDVCHQGGNGINFGRMSIDKSFGGDLAATSKGEMFSATTAVQGSAAYVALEQVNGTLDGKNGSFVLQHYGVMNHGNSRLILEVVPDSATEELSGLSGKMTINIDNGKHFYEFEYELPKENGSQKKTGEYV
jgi:hypothetical protein